MSAPSSTNPQIGTTKPHPRLAVKNEMTMLSAAMIGAP